jgi:hypothetical protein
MGIDALESDDRGSGTPTNMPVIVPSLLPGRANRKIGLWKTLIWRASRGRTFTPR